jgi:zinc protease
MLQSFVASGPSDAELDAAQSYLQNGFVFAVDTAQRRLSELLSARLLGHPDEWVDGTVERLRKIPHTDPVRAVRQHLRPDDLLLTVVGTASEIEPQLAAWPRIGELSVVDWQTPL